MEVYKQKTNPKATLVAITVFDLITAHAPISAQSSNLVI